MTYEDKLRDQIKRYEQLLAKKEKEVESIKFVIEVTKNQLNKNGDCNERSVQAKLDSIRFVIEVTKNQLEKNGGHKDERRL